MNQLSKFLGPMVLLTGVLGACNVAAAAPAGATVFQRTENTQSIELSNIEDEGAPSVPVAVETKTPVNSAKAVDPIPTKTPALSAAPKVAKKKSATDGTDDEEVAEGDEPETRQGRADANRAGDKDRNETATTASFGGGFSGSAGTTAGTSSGTSGTSSGGSTTTSTGTGAGAGTSAGAGTGSSTGTGTTAGTGGSTGSGSLPAVPAAPPTQTSLETKLVQYRDQMLQEVANAQVANPAIARRYQMTDKATFQSRAGL